MKEAKVYLSNREIDVLEDLRRIGEGGHSIAGIASNLGRGTGRTAVEKWCKRLEGLGLVEECGAKWDAGSRWVTITEGGRSWLEDAGL